MEKNIISRFVRIQRKSDRALFGGKSTEQIDNESAQRPTVSGFSPDNNHQGKGLSPTKLPILQWSVMICRTEDGITGEHVKNNREVRNLLVKRNIKPESLPPAEDAKRWKDSLSPNKRNY